jgi:hypothetical protein
MSRLIRWGTAYPLAPAGLRLGPSHVAIGIRHEGQTLWAEATTLAARPCLIAGQMVSGCQVHQPEDRIADYVEAGGRVVVYRLSPVNQLDRGETMLLTKIVLKHFVLPGVRYDYGGAVLSGTRLLQLTSLFPSAALDSLFCSELIAALLMRLGRLGRDNPTRYNPARLLRRLVRDGTYCLAGES